MTLLACSAIDAAELKQMHAQAALEHLILSGILFGCVMVAVALKKRSLIGFALLGFSIVFHPYWTVPCLSDCGASKLLYSKIVTGFIGCILAISVLLRNKPNQQ